MAAWLRCGSRRGSPLAGGGEADGSSLTQALANLAIDLLIALTLDLR